MSTVEDATFARALLLDATITHVTYTMERGRAFIDLEFEKDRVTGTVRIESDPRDFLRMRAAQFTVSS